MKIALIILFVSQCLWAQFNLARRNFESPNDSIEVILLKVEFQKENPDNSLTTGLGVFNSDPDTIDVNYSLDAQGKRNTKKYWQDHFEYINGYFSAVSNNKLKIGLKVYPEKDDSAYVVPKQIIDYNRTQRNDDEKLAAFDSARIVDYMNFIQDAVYSADSSAVSPFKNLAPASLGVKRLFVILHAGASRMLDGGSLGTKGADTPGDFIDAYIDVTDFDYLKTADSLRRKDSLGIALNYPAIDTFTQVIVMSETNSQDGLNWGTNGMLIHLMSRAMGMPITYNAATGVSRLGYFDALDFAGANASNGFFPVYPSAWLRYYMGWEKAVELKPGDYDTHTLVATGDTLSGTKLFKIPLNSGEYLLIENRQRSLDDSGKVTLYNDKDESLVVRIDSLNAVFLDSICEPEKDCVPNTKKASGILKKASHYDLGLPASGIAVWHVNEWIINQTLAYGYVNAEQNELSNDFHGLYLIEADGVKGLGVEVSTAIGKNAFDYGSGLDLWPSKKIEGEWVKELNSFGSKSSQSWSGGINHLSIKFEIDSLARLEKTYSASIGDSVVNLASRQIKFSLDWGGIRPVGGVFPVYTGALASEEAFLVSQNTVFFGDAYSNLRGLDSLGNDIGSIDAKVLKMVGADSVKMLLADGSLGEIDTLMLKSLLKVNDLKALQSYQNNMRLMSSNKTSNYEFNESDSSLSLIEEKALDNFRFSAGNAIQYVSTNDSISFKDGAWQKSHGVNTTKQMSVVDDVAYVIDASAKLFEVSSSSTELKYKTFKNFKKSIHDSTATWVLSISDINRDQNENIIMWSSKGEILSFEMGSETIDFHYVFKKTKGLKDLALGDINDDGYVDIAVVIDQGLLVLDYKGIPLKGFPFEFREQSIVAPITDKGVESWYTSSPLILDVNGDKYPEVLIATSAGLIHAIDYKGQEASSLGVGLSTNEWPLSFGHPGFGADKAKRPSLLASFINEDLRLYAHSGSEIHAFILPVANEDKLQWAKLGANNNNTWYLESGLLKEPEADVDQSVINELFVFPNPIKSKMASLHVNLGADSKKAHFRVFDISGNQVFNQNLGVITKGGVRFENIEFGRLGSDTYKLYLEVEFEDGTKKTKWFNFAVVR